MTSPSDLPQTSGTLEMVPVDDGLHHLFDRDPNVALCGRDLTLVPERPPLETEGLCVVCYELDEVLPL